MTFKTILAPVISLDPDEAALAAARALARSNGGHAVTLILAVHPASEFSSKNASLSEVLEDIALRPMGQTAMSQRDIESWLSRSDIPFEQRPLLIADALVDGRILAHARHADLTVMTRPAGEADRVRWIMWEKVLFGSGRPVLLAPPGWAGEELGRRILVAWNAKREASRAVADAVPLIANADAVKIVTIDAAPNKAGHGESPGHDLATLLARHGAHVEVENLDRLERSSAQRLIDAAEAMEADLIVMGGYGHARAAEWLLGGATREMASSSPLPIFMSH